MKLRTFMKDRLVDADTNALLDAMPVQLGSRGFDPWGLNLDNTKIALSFVKWLYQKYFRVEAHGLENIPKEGRVLIIPNHSGQLPMDGLMTAYAVATNPHGPRMPRAMIERFFPTVPWIGNLLNSWGAVIGDPLNCVKMLKRDEAIIVFPEGVRGSGKPYKLRYQLQRFGNGFLHLAMESGAPIIPVGIVGCEETMPSLGSIKPLARLLRIPYVPIAPLVPLPAKVIINFGQPMRFDNKATNEQEVTERTREVKAEIRKLIEKGQSERKSVFDGLTPARSG
ncbi:MAG: lysophospholipid acyltransferase family protein [Nevskiales bacterium]